MEFLKLLNERDFVVNWKVKDFRQDEEELFYRVEVEIKDKSRLFAKDYSKMEYRSYSFHWQDSDHKMIVRWDNAPNHPDVATFPHHKHLPNSIEESKEMSLEEVLDFIETYIDKKTAER